MKSAVSIVLSVLIVLVGLPAAALAQSNTRESLASSDWSRVREVDPGTRFSGGSDRGYLVHDDDTQPVAQRAPRQSSQSVATKKSHHVGRWIAIGAAAFGAVMLVWFIHYANCGCG